MAFNANKKIIGNKESVPVTFEALRLALSLLKMESWMVTLVSVEGGYQFRVHASYQYDRPLVICAEKSKLTRVFKTVESALNVSRKLGFDAVRVEL